MNWQVLIETPAQSDIDEAFVWYEEQSNDLGFRFIDSLEKVIESITSNPYFASFVLKDIRSASLLIFPYEVLYLIDETKESVFVLAVGHLHRKPGWFKQRLK